KKNPIKPITPEVMIVFFGPILSVKNPPNPEPIPEAIATGVTQKPALAAGTCKTCCTYDGINTIVAKNPPDKTPKNMMSKKDLLRKMLYEITVSPPLASSFFSYVKNK